jgi:arylsulfatase A-like enzyme
MFSVTSFADKPNVLFVMVDEMRADALGCSTNNSVYQTPALDKLAAEGTRFDKAYTVAAVCVSSRYSFFTSRYSHVHGAIDNSVPIRAAQILLPSVMKNLGYQTAISGKLHFAPNDQDFDFDNFWSYSNDGPKKLETWSQYLTAKHGAAARKLLEQPFPNHQPGGDIGKLSYPKEDTQSYWITDRAVEFFNIRDKTKPFFLFVSYLEPHSPSHLAEPYWSLYQEELKKVKLPPTFVPNREPSPADGVNRQGRSFISDPEVVKAMIAAYHIKVKQIDDNIERLLDGLKKAGLEDDTLIIFTADHGNMLGDHNRWFKGVPHEGSSKIPLIVKAPKNSSYAASFNQGKVIEKNVESIDVMPAILDIIGKPLPDDAGFQGKSFVKLTAGQDPNWKDTAYSERRGLMVRHQDYKLIRLDPNYGGEYFLYDLKNDPQETKDLKDEPQHKPVFESLKQKLDDWQKNDPPVPHYPGLEPKFQPITKEAVEQKHEDRREAKRKQREREKKDAGQ